MNQIIGLIIRVKFKDGSIKSLSTNRKGTLNYQVKISTLLKHLLVLISEI